MPKQASDSSKAFLASVQRHVMRLDAGQQREVLAEVAAHLQDAESSLLAEGVPAERVRSKAVEAMGDPRAIGRRIQNEHLGRRLPLREAVLAGLPLALFPVLFYLTPLWNPNIDGPFRLYGDDIRVALLLVGAPLGLIIWLHKANGGWAGAAAGIVAVLSMMTFGTAIPIGDHFSHSEAWLALATAPFVMLFALRCGTLRASTAVLAGIGAYGVSGWLEISPSGSQLLICLLPCAGIVALGMAPRRWQFATAWLALGGNWLVIVLLGVFHFVGPRGIPNEQWPGLADLRYITSLPLIASSVAFLLVVQVSATIQARLAGRHIVEALVRDEVESVT